MKSLSLPFLCASAFLIFSCGNTPVKEDFSNYRYLMEDTLNVFKVGEQFVFTESENSCCQNGWIVNGRFASAMQHKGLINPVRSASDIADPDCAGCSSYFTTVFECIKPGRDTLYYAYVPHGANLEMMDDSPDSDTVPADDVEVVNTLNEYTRRYIFEIR
ncbi:MAG: hypothetical protein MH137_10680 [Flavobacteriales bacterium]|nr:hypothetical protein [Flavobacteriales bacterium]